MNKELNEAAEKKLYLDIKAALMCAIYTKKPLERIIEDLLIKVKAWQAEQKQNADNEVNE